MTDKETPWWWYILVLVISFIIGLVVVIKENITLPVWAYIVSLLLGIFIAPLVSYRHSMPPSLDSQGAISNLEIYRALCSTLGMATVLPQTICQRCWLV